MGAESSAERRLFPDSKLVGEVSAREEVGAKLLIQSLSSPAFRAYIPAASPARLVSAEFSARFQV